MIRFARKWIAASLASVKMKRSSCSLPGAFALLLRMAEPVFAGPSNGTIEKPRVFYCPFDVGVSLASDLSSIGIKYSTSQSQEVVFAQDKVACYVRVAFRFQPTDTVTIREIEYKGDFRNGERGGDLQTKLAWDENLTTPGSGSMGPVSLSPDFPYSFSRANCSQTHFTSVAVSYSEENSIATNSTPAMGVGCGYFDDRSAGINVHTTFHPSASGLGLGGTLTQSLKLSYYGSCNVEIPMCDYLDVDGNSFPNCTDRVWKCC